MPTDLASATERVLDYLAERGGVVEVPPGRALLRVIADDLDWTRAELTAALAELEAEGLVARGVRDRRTYRLALVGDESEEDAEAEEAAPEPEVAGAPDADAHGSAADPAAESGGDATGAPAAGPWAAPSWEPPTDPEPAAKRSRFGRRAKAEKEPKPEKVKPEKAEKVKRNRGEKPPKSPKAMTGVVYEIREMEGRSFEGISGQPISRHRTNGEAFAELRRLTGARSGGHFRPRVVVRIDPDGTEDIAIPFDEQDRPLHFAFKLSGGRR